MVAEKFYTQVQHHLEEQVFRRAVGFHVVGKEVVHGKLLWCVIHILHIRAVQLQHAETNVQFVDALLVCVFFLDFLSGAADAFFADLADGLVALVFLCFADLFR